MFFYLKNLVTGLLYSLTFILGYVFFLNAYFEYMGFVLPNTIDKLLLSTSVVITLIPLVFYRGMKAPSSFIAVFIYFILYTPIVLTFALGLNQSSLSIIIIQLTFMLGMSILFLADFITINKTLYVRSRFNMYRLILFLTIFSSLYMIYTYGGNLNFVSYEEVYTQRSENESLGKGLVTRYLSSWLSNVMIPICLTHGLINKKRIYFITGTLACLIIFMSTADKIAIVFPFVFLGFYLLFSKNRIDKAFTILGLTLVFMMGVALIVEFNVISSLFWMRTIGNGGLLTLSYFEFFNDHPHTYYTHINIVKAISGSYPYGDKGLGQVVGQHFWSEDMNANANFWATDGIASLGLSGVLLISVIFFIMFILLNNIVKSYNKLFVVMCMIPFLSAILNSSFFSALWTGGAILMMVFFTVANKREDVFSDPVNKN